MSAKDAGRILLKARQKMAASLEEASAVTRIRSHYLEALENGDFGLLPSPVQVRGFLRTYAEYLGLDPAEIFSIHISHSREIEQKKQTSEFNDDEQKSQAKTQVQVVFSEIGAALRERRELLELNFAEIEKSIRIPGHHLQRLELGEFDAFPSPTQARGMLNNYANFLGLETDQLLQRYAEAIQSRFQKQPEQVRRKLTALRPPLLRPQLPSWLRRAFSPDILIGALLTLALGSLFIWGIGRITATRAELGSQPTAPPLAELLLPTSSPTLEYSPTTANESGTNGETVAESTPTPDAVVQITIQVANPSGVELRVLPNQRVWARVTTDGNVDFEGRMAPGITYSYSANSEILLFTGNAAALRIFLNGQDYGILGIDGEVVNLHFSADGIATPTASPQPTLDPGAATATSIPSLTPSLAPNADAEDTGP